LEEGFALKPVPEGIEVINDIGLTPLMLCCDFHCCDDDDRGDVLFGLLGG
jgi:hypothetical protein